jgi:hypothetical protein
MRVVMGLAVLVVGCGGSAEAEPDGAPDCERSAYELERTRYRCASEGELQTLECGGWETVEVCAEPDACSPGPDPGCG